MNDEIFHLHEEYKESVKQYLWFQESPHSFFKGKASKVEAERHRIMANYYWSTLIKRVRSVK